MKIILIQPKARGTFKSPPLGLQLLATVLRGRGFDSIYDLDPDKGDDLYSFDYSDAVVLVGMSVTYMTLSSAIKLAEFIKQKNPRAIIVFGGPHATLEPYDAINSRNVDVVVLGEGEETIIEIADAIKEGKPFKDIKGLWYKSGNGEIIKNERREFKKNLDLLPFADRIFFSDYKYQNTIIERLFRPVIWHLMSSRSCPYTCKMCQPALRKIAGPWRQRSVKSVLAEIGYLREAFKAKYFSFYDNDMGINREWMVNLCCELNKIKESSNISLACAGRANLLDYDILKLIKEAGFDSVAFGAESGSERVLKEIIDKKTSVKDIVNFASNCFRLKIRAGAFWMIGNPGETVEEMKETIRLASELPVFYCHFHIANPPPGTQYYFDALHGGYLKMQSWDDVHDRRKPVIIKDNVTPADVAEIDELLIETMVKKGWNYRLNGHTLSFINTRLFAKYHPFKVFANEALMFFEDFRFYHFRNIYLGIKCLLGIDKPGKYNA